MKVVGSPVPDCHQPDQLWQTVAAELRRSACGDFLYHGV